MLLHLFGSDSLVAFGFLVIREGAMVRAEVTMVRANGNDLGDESGELKATQRARNHEDGGAREAIRFGVMELLFDEVDPDAFLSRWGFKGGIHEEL